MQATSPEFPLLSGTLGLMAGHAPQDTPALFATDSNEFIHFMCPVLGPTATIIAHQVAGWLHAPGKQVMIDVDELAGRFGLNRATLSKAMRRLVMFHQLEEMHGWLVFYTAVHHYPVRWAERLPKVLLDELVEWQRLVVAGR